MLIGQASINLSANILSALLGLLSVFVFTRLFSPHEYGTYLLGQVTQSSSQLRFTATKCSHYNSQDEEKL